MNIWERGHGPTVVCLHGTAPPESLYGLAERLSDAFRVIVPALPGYAGSPQVEPRTPAAVQREIAGLVEEFDEAVSLLGHSGGAYHALCLATQLPERVARLALLAPTHHITAELKQELPQFATAAREGQLSFEAVLPLWFSEEYAAAHPDAIDVVAAAFERDIDALADDLDSYALAEDLRGAFSELDQPVFIRTGSEDTRAPVDYVRELEQLIPHAEFDVVDGASHFVHDEDAEQTELALRTFFSEE